MQQLTAILFTLCLASTAVSASPASQRPVPAPEDTVEHFESRVRTTAYTRTTTTESPTRAVVEHAWSSTYDEDWSSSWYARAEWTTDEGHRSEELRDQRTTIRTRARPIKIVRPTMPIGGRRCFDE